MNSAISETGGFHPESLRRFALTCWYRWVFQLLFDHCRTNRDLGRGRAWPSLDEIHEGSNQRGREVHVRWFSSHQETCCQQGLRDTWLIETQQRFGSGWRNWELATEAAKEPWEPALTQWGRGDGSKFGEFLQGIPWESPVVHITAGVFFDVNNHPKYANK